MKQMRELLGYMLGGMLFVVLMPVVMWMVSGKPELWPVPMARCILSIVAMLGGLALSIWTIVYMRRVGKGNPLDAFGHEVAPRTSRLMTDGPYRMNRNPMLSGTLIYLIGVALWLWQWQAWIVWLIFLSIMMVQVMSEERRLRSDFGEEYTNYCHRTRRF